MRKIRRVYMTLALAVLLAGMTACGNNTTNDTGNGNTNTESDMGQTDNRNDVNTTEMPSNDNVNDVTEGTDGNANGTNGTNTGDRNTLGDDVGDAAEDVKNQKSVYDAGIGGITGRDDGLWKQHHE